MPGKHLGVSEYFTIAFQFLYNYKYCINKNYIDVIQNIAQIFVKLLYNPPKTVQHRPIEPVFLISR
jgi:hypothetical protein